jgi:hypothetical protein
MIEFFRNLSTYIRETEFGSLTFWIFPICSLFLTWALTTVGLKVLSKGGRLQTVFYIKRAWIISSTITSFILITLICIWWSKNFFAKHPFQLSLLISLTITMSIPLLALLNLKAYFTQDRIKEITAQPKTLHQLDETIAYTKKSFRKNKVFLIIPVFAFLFLFLYFNKGTNLISLVYDNSGSMIQKSAIDALYETFDNLQDNNEIILTTLEGFSSPDDPAGKTTMKELMLVNNPSALKGGNVVSFNNPQDAKNGLIQIENKCFGSPICESIWKTFLFINETRSSVVYKNKLLVVITDGQDNIDASLNSGQFFFDNESFNGYFQPENTFIIDYSSGTTSALIQRFQNSGCDIYPSENNKQAYLDALDNALQSFKNNWYLIFWTVFIYSIFTITGLLIQPKKII